MLPISPETVRGHLCTLPSADLIHGEWQKHGTRAFDTLDAYLDRIERLWSALHEPDLAELRASTVGELKRAFVMADTAIGLVVRLGRGGSLRDIMVCYDTRFDLMTCAERGAPMQRIRIR